MNEFDTPPSGDAEEPTQLPSTDSHFDREAALREYYESALGDDVAPTERGEAVGQELRSRGDRPDSSTNQRPAELKMTDRIDLGDIDPNNL